eukprot:XP_017945388.1 PREDICTED: LOW QUALITY PROTEIN: transmembrane protein 232 [Xenopus tropicalis]
MPVVKIPVVQKFGIISTKYHHDLQQSLLQSSTVSEHKHRPHRPLEITEDFIKQFNSAEDLEEKERMLDTARQILHRCKRRSKLNLKGSGNHVDLHFAWTELILLTQCKGNIQEEVIDILLISMDQVNFDQENISLLFFMAESILYKLCCDVTQKPCLCSFDVKLSKLGFLTFLRLHVFNYDEQREHLSTYLEALQSCRSVYEPFPYVLSSVHAMLKVCTMICSPDIPLESHSSLQINTDFKLAVTKPGGAEMNSFVWNCLEIWLHVQINSIHLQKSLHHLCQLNGGLHQENWLDSLLSLFILGEAAKLDISCLKALMELAHNYITSPLHLPVQNSELPFSPFTSWPWEVIYAYIMVLSDICLHGTTAEIQKHAFTGFLDKNGTAISTHEAGLHGLLFFTHPQASEACNKMDWIIHYGTVYNLVKVCNALQMDVNRSGLRNAIWKALNRCSEKDKQIIDAVKVAEAELNGPANTFINASSKTSLTPVSLGSCQYVGLRIASALSQHFLPPVVPYIPLPKKQVYSQRQIKLSKLKEGKTEKLVSHPSLREQYFSTEPYTARPDFLTRTNTDLQRVMDEQWAKEIEYRMEEDKEELQRKQQEGQKKQEEHFKEIMKRREQKLKKTTKPYELPLTSSTQ